MVQNISTQSQTVHEETTKWAEESDDSESDRLSLKRAGKINLLNKYGVNFDAPRPLRSHVTSLCADRKSTSALLIARVSGRASWSSLKAQVVIGCRALRRNFTLLTYHDFSSPLILVIFISYSYSVKYSQSGSKIKVRNSKCIDVSVKTDSSCHRAYI